VDAAEKTVKSSMMNTTVYCRAYADLMKAKEMLVMYTIRDDNEKVLAVDIAKAYYRCLVNNKYDYARYIVSDQPRTYTDTPFLSCGEYLVNSFTIPQLGDVAFKKQLWTTGLIKYLVQKK